MSTAVATDPRAGGELVPIADRLRYMQVFRLCVVAAVAAIAGFSSASLIVGTGELAGVTAAYVVLAGATHLAWRVSRRGGLALFGFMLMVDGIYLALAAYAAGGDLGPLRYLAVLHVIAVALLASHRTGMKLALWHSLLLLVVYYGRQAEILAPLPEAHGAGLTSPMAQLFAYSAVFWLVALATATFSAVNERELRRRRYDMEALAVTAGRLEEAQDPRTAADALLTGIVDALDFDRALLVVAHDGEELSVAASHGAEIGVTSGEQRPVPGSVLAVAMAERRTLLISRLDEQADGWLATLLPDARNLAIVPMMADGQAIGAAVTEHSLRSGSRVERRVVEMLERFCSHGGLALHSAWLLERVQRMASTDGLTGVANRRTFETTLERELARAARESEDVTLVMLDVDHFKRLNDTHGHLVGDEVLRRVAAAVTQASRQYDTPARYGGEEFAVILPGTSKEDGLEVAERLRLAIAGSGEDPAVTASAGLATFPADAVEPRALVDAADGALYESKRTGRNRVTAAAGPAEPTLIG
jgi:diguanylate cyclase (GGDEF)-like protein